MTEEECGSLWVYTDGKQCVSCWRLTFKERLLALLHGNIWLLVYCGHTQPPVTVLCGKTVFIRKE